MKEFTLFFAVLIVTSLCLVGCNKTPAANCYCKGECSTTGECLCKDVCCCNKDKCILKEKE